jgi:hypothetical protein
MSAILDGGRPLLVFALGRGKFAKRQFELGRYNQIVEELKRFPADISLKYQTRALRKAAKPGQEALRRVTGDITQVTGNLLASVSKAERKYTNNKASTPVGVIVIGYRRPVNQNSQKGATPAFAGGSVLKGPNRAYHSHLLESGTKPRRPGYKTRTKRAGRVVFNGRIRTQYRSETAQSGNQSGILSSFRTRGAFKGAGRGRYPVDFIATGQVAGTPAQRPLSKAFQQSKAQMQSVLDVELRKALKSASREYQKRFGNLNP